MELESPLCPLESCPEKTCRICLESSSHDLISPCLCSGSMKYVHRSCLDKWRADDPTRQKFNTCDICKYGFQYGPIVSHPSSLYCKYYFWITFDLLFFINVVHTIIIIITFLIYYTHPWQLPKLSEFISAYFSGWIIFLAFIGFCGMIWTCTSTSGGQTCICLYGNNDCDEGGGIAILVILVFFGLLIGIYFSVIFLTERFEKRRSKIFLGLQTKIYIVKNYEVV